MRRDTLMPMVVIDPDRTPTNSTFHVDKFEDGAVGRLDREKTSKLGLVAPGVVEDLEFWCNSDESVDYTSSSDSSPPSSSSSRSSSSDEDDNEDYEEELDDENDDFEETFPTVTRTNGATGHGGARVKARMDLARRCHTYLASAFPSGKGRWRGTTLAPPPMGWLVEHLPVGCESEEGGDMVYLALLLVEKYRPRVGVSATSKAEDDDEEVGREGGPGEGSLDALLNELDNPSPFPTLVFVAAMEVITAPADLVVDKARLTHWADAYFLRGSEEDLGRVWREVRGVYEESGWGEMGTADKWRRLFGELEEFKRALRVR